MYNRYKKILVLFFIAAFCCNAKAQQFYFIPAQQFYPYQLLNPDTYGWFPSVKKTQFKISAKAIEISEQVNFGEYKKYLTDIKRDSSYSFYLSQLPDSSILSEENYTKYISDKKYDAYPVVGIKWLAAMNYCKWRTLQENKDRSIQFIYRLPHVSEWLAAYQYLDSNKISNDLNRNYSDYTINSYFEGWYGSDSIFYDDFVYIPKEKDHPRDKRIRVIGNSYLSQSENLLLSYSHYSYKGYRYIAFRLVKEKLSDTEKSALDKSIINYWGLQ